jgi:hypothetical protein
MALRERLTAKVAKVYTKVWKKLEGPGQSVVLLKASGTEKEFEDVLEFSSDWFLEYSEFRQAFRLQIARDESIAGSIAVATHVRVGDDVYVIRNADTVPPKGADVTWKLFCDRFAQREQFRSLY